VTEALPAHTGPIGEQIPQKAFISLLARTEGATCKDVGPFNGIMSLISDQYGPMSPQSLEKTGEHIEVHRESTRLRKRIGVYLGATRQPSDRS
jgi:hypothetical protein